MKNLLLTAIILILLTGCTSAPVINEDTRTLPPCGSLPNCVNSESGEDSQAIDPINASAAQWQRLITWVAGQDDWEVIYQQDHLIHAVNRTPLLKFKDDVVLKFDPDKQLIQVRSSSRLGISDLGANRARVEFLRNLVAG